MLFSTHSFPSSPPFFPKYNPPLQMILEQTAKASRGILIVLRLYNMGRIY